MLKAETAVAAGLTVRDIMHSGVVAVVQEMTVRELAQTFVEKRISGAPVLDPEGKPIGVVSATDVMQLIAREAEIPSGQVDWAPALLAEELSAGEAGEEVAGTVFFTVPDPGALAESGLDQYCVGHIMTPVAFTVHPADSLRDVIRFFLRGRVHRALVMEHGALLGIVTPFDVLQVWDAALDADPSPVRSEPAA